MEKRGFQGISEVAKRLGVTPEMGPQDLKVEAEDGRSYSVIALYLAVLGEMVKETFYALVPPLELFETLEGQDEAQ